MSSVKTSIANTLDNELIRKSLQSMEIIVDDSTDLYNVLDRFTILDLESLEIDLDVFRYLGEVMKSNKTITILNLFDTSMKNEHASLLSEGLKGNNTLKSLFLGGNRIKSAGVKSISEMLKVNDSITKLDLYDNLIGNSGVKSIFDSLKVNKKLRSIVIGNQKISQKTIGVIKECLLVNDTIESMSFTRCFINVDISSLLPRTENVTLKKLLLEDNGLGCYWDTFFQALEKSTLEELSLQACNINKYSKSFCDSLSYNTSLTKLNLSMCEIDFLKPLSDSLKVNNTLTSLDLSHNMIIQSEELYYLYEGLKVNDSIKRIDIDNNDLKGSISALCDVFSYNRTINSLDLSSCKLSIEDYRTLFKSLETNETLLSLKMIYHYREKLPIGEYVRDALISNKTLMFLTLSGFGLDNREVVLISEGLAYNYTLVGLDLSRNHIGSKGLEVILRTVKDNMSLSMLSLYMGGFNNEPVNDLYDLFESNSRIKVNAISEAFDETQLDSLKEHKDRLLINEIFKFKIEEKRIKKKAIYSV